MQSARLVINMTLDQFQPAGIAGEGSAVRVCVQQGKNERRTWNGGE